mmetsp:Transcript_28637/g.88560  ORF Transcript_28637/g.88560 Transcript_28637/m.88560 type:complete len:229 (-) Transcript_28637:924-1610(-)
MADAQHPSQLVHVKSDDPRRRQDPVRLERRRFLELYDDVLRGDDVRRVRVAFAGSFHGPERQALALVAQRPAAQPHDAARGGFHLHVSAERDRLGLLALGRQPQRDLPRCRPVQDAGNDQLLLHRNHLDQRLVEVLLLEQKVRARHVLAREDGAGLDRAVVARDGLHEGLLARLAPRGVRQSAHVHPRRVEPRVDPRAEHAVVKVESVRRGVLADARHQRSPGLEAVV